MKGKHYKVPVVYNGKRYDSVREMEIELGFTKGYVFYYLKFDKPLNGEYVDYAFNNQF